MFATLDAGEGIAGYYFADSVARLRRTWPIAARKRLLATGLCSRTKPLSCASFSRSGALSPVISMAGISSLYSDWMRWIT